jgi:AcrR family transcriptional regulator
MPKKTAVTKVPPKTRPLPPVAGGRGRRPFWTQRQEEILDHLERIFLAEGFRHLTLQDLTDEVHCSRTILYALAPTKEELALAVIDRFFRKVAAEVTAAVSRATTPAARVEGVLDAIAAGFEPATRRFFADLESYGPSNDLHMKHAHHATGRVQEIVTEGIDSGAFRHVDAQFAAAVVNLLMSSISDGRLPESANLTSAQCVIQLKEMLFHGLLLDEPARAGASKSA